MCALIASRLIALDKCPGVRPVGIRETLRRLFSKEIISKCRWEASQVAGIE